MRYTEYACRNACRSTCRLSSISVTVFNKTEMCWHSPEKSTQIFTYLCTIMSIPIINMLLDHTVYYINILLNYDRPRTYRNTSVDAAVTIISTPLFYATDLSTPQSNITKIQFHSWFFGSFKVLYVVRKWLSQNIKKKKATFIVNFLTVTNLLKLLSYLIGFLDEVCWWLFKNTTYEILGICDCIQKKLFHFHPTLGNGTFGQTWSHTFCWLLL
jgi:hypothetical protein